MPAPRRVLSAPARSCHAMPACLQRLVDANAIATHHKLLVVQRNQPPKSFQCKVIEKRGGRTKEVATNGRGSQPRATMPALCFSKPPFNQLLAEATMYTRYNPPSDIYERPALLPPSPGPHANAARTKVGWDPSFSGALAWEEH